VGKKKVLTTAPVRALPSSPKTKSRRNGRDIYMHVWQRHVTTRVRALSSTPNALWGLGFWVEAFGV
jgi:hypothetical protein